MHFSYFALVLLFSVPPAPSRAAEAGGNLFLRGSGGRSAPPTEEASLLLYVGPDGDDAASNDGATRAAPFRTLARATRAAREAGASTRGGEIVLLAGRYDWEEEGGLVEGLVGPSGDDPFVVRAEGEVLLDGSDGLPPCPSG
ncbi:hypothetical protein THAOC_20831, partial [Thalassiosira oceanica]